MLLFTFAGQSEWIVLFLFGGTQWKNKKSKSLRSCQWNCQRRLIWTTPLKPCRTLYEPMSVSHILRFGQKESRWTPQQESSGIRFYRSFNVPVSNFKKGFYVLHLHQNCIWAPLFAAIFTTSST